MIDWSVRAGEVIPSACAGRINLAARTFRREKTWRLVVRQHVAMARLVLEHVAKQYAGGHWALRDVSFEVADGELLVVLGPSGCGKTTLLRLVAGLEEPSTGEIVLGDRPLRGVPPRERDVAMTFQTPALYPHLTAAENIGFSLRMRGVPRGAIRQRVIEAARLLGVEGLLERLPRELSGGEAQRVALGRALVRRPACYLFDEPLAALDARLRVELRTAIKRQHRHRPTTTLYVTHDQEEALALGERIAVFWQGQVQQVGTAEDVYRRPANRFVAGFLGSPPMNFLPGTIVRTEKQVWFQSGPCRLAQLDPCWGALAGRSLVLGLRPETLRLAAPDASGATGIRGRVGWVALVGDRADVEVELADSLRLVARVQTSGAPTPGSSVSVQAHSGHLLLFEPGEFGRRVDPPLERPAGS